MASHCWTQRIVFRTLLAFFFFFFLINVPETSLWNYFDTFIIYCSVSGITETNYIFVSTENNLLIQTVKCSLLKEKEKARGMLHLRSALEYAHFIVICRCLLTHPSYARNRASALPSPSPFHYLMAKIAIAMQLATHAKSSTLYGRSIFFRLDGLLLFPMIVRLSSATIMGLRCARCELCFHCGITEWCKSTLI